MVYYLDTSALVKRYVFEVGSLWLLGLCELASGNVIATASITKVEAAAAFAVKHRQKQLSLRLYNRLLQRLNDDFTHEYQLLSVDADLVEVATKLTQRHTLRGYDAIQLAAAMTLQQRLIQTRLPALQFLASDADLMIAAQGEGLSIDNPELHP